MNQMHSDNSQTNNESFEDSQARDESAHPDATSSIVTRSHPSTPSYLIWLSVFLLVIAVCICYSNSITGQFLLDDEAVILENPTIHQLWPLGMFQASAQDPGFLAKHTVFSRPVTTWTFALNYALGGLNVVGYHLFNVFIHLCSTLLVFGLVRRTLSTDRLKSLMGEHAWLIALAVALCWGLHPIQTHAINYLTQRLESLAGLFYLSTIYCLLRSHSSTRASIWLVLGVLTAFLGMGCKETMATAPLVALLFDRTFLAGNFRDALVRRKWFYLGLVLAWVFLLILISDGHQTSIGVNDRHTQTTPLSYALTELGVILHYLGLIVWPHPLIFDYGWPIAKTVNAILWPGLAIAAMLTGVLWGLRKNAAWAFLGAWFFVILSPSSSVVPISDEFVNEYRLYLPLLAPLTLIIVGLYLGLDRFNAQRAEIDPISSSTKARLFFAPVAMAALVLGVLTYQRNFDYATNISIWADAAQKAPDNTRAHYNYGTFLLLNNRIDDAGREFARTIELDDDYAGAHANLGYVEMKKKHVDAAIDEFKKATKADPKNIAARINLAVAYEQNHRLDEALVEYRNALAINPAAAGVYSSLGGVLSKLKRFDEAITYFKKSIELEPTYSDAHANYAATLIQMNQPDQALVEAQTALKLNPRNATALNLYGVLLANSKRFGDAVNAFRQAWALNPNDAGARGNLQAALRDLGEALLKQGDKEGAKAPYKELLTLNPNDEMAQKALAALSAP